jgi:hypothetical protein
MLATVGVFSFAGATSASAAPTDITVCASGCDFATIQGAVSAASPGDTIFVAAGTYTEVADIRTDGITLRGAQAGVDARSRAGAESVLSQGRILLNADNVTIDGFTIVDSRAPAGSGTSVSAIFGQNIEGTRIVNNIIGENFIGAQFDNAGGSAPALIQYNLFRNNTLTGQESSGTGVFMHGGGGSRNVTITDNAFTGHQNAAINAALRDALISNNSSVNDSTLVVLIGSTEVEISNHSAQGLGGSGLYFGLGVSNVTIENNILHSEAARGEGKAAIRFATVSGSGAAPQGVTVTGNTTTGGWDFGMHIASGAYTGELEAHENSFSALVQNLDGGATVDATLNYWGPLVDRSAMTNVSYTPWYLNPARTTRSDQGVTPNENGEAQATPSAPAVVISSSSDPITVTVAEDVNGATIDFSALQDGAGVATLPETTIATSDGVSVQFPAGTTVTADGTWDGVISAPAFIPADRIDTPTDVNISSAIKVGAENVGLVFDRAVRLVIPGEAGSLVGFVSPGGEFTPITAECASDSQVAGDAVTRDCSISVGDDLVVWTKHFTVFAAYQSAGTLPPTGANTAPLWIATMTLLALGTVFTAAGYRRRSGASRS